MTIATDLDTWAAALGTAVGVAATRDPDKVFPPCLWIDLPVVSAATLPAITLEVPVWVVGAGTGKPSSDAVLDLLPKALDHAHTKTATPGSLTIGGQEFHGYQLVAQLRLLLEDPPPPPPPVNPALAVDNYSDGFVRIQYLPLLDDQQQHDGLTLGLATIPGPGGELLADLAALESLRGDVWYDHNGTLGHVLTGNGQNLGPTLLARYIREQRTIDAQLDLSTTPPTFHIRFAHLPPSPATT